MNPISWIYTEILFRPIFNLLVGIANIMPGHNIGLSIIAVTVLVRLILLPSFLHQAKSMQANQTKMQKVKKELEKIKKEHKGDKAKESEATMKLYKEAGINPAQGCLPLLIQLPILIALYRVFFTGIGPSTFHYLYSFIPALSTIGSNFLGINLAAPSLVLAAFAGLGQFAQMKFIGNAATPAATGDDDTAQIMASMQKNMAYMFPVMTIIIAIKLPAALPLYWLTSTLLGLAQQYWFKNHLKLTQLTPSM
jgi:YidC/Oxa1 family membrane protein insertase